MNSVVEKLTVLEQEVAALLPKMAPLTERISALDQKVTGFAQQLTDLAAESATVKQDIEHTGNSLTHILTLVGESKAESEQLAGGLEENQQRYKTMEAFVGTLYQLHSQSVEIAQWLGHTDQAKAIFPAPPSAPTGESPWQTEAGGRMEQLAEEVASSDAGFDAAMPDAIKEEPTPWEMPPNLPDVAALPEMETVHSDVEPPDAEPSDAEPSCEMASQLDVAPLNLAVPALPEPNESTEIDEKDEQEIEEMLATMMTPVTVGN